ncbi:MAG: sulfotransferase domain-containing protein [Sedimenticola sp.]
MNESLLRRYTPKASDNNMEDKNQSEIPLRRGFPPSLFIIGSQKSGTTFLADMLGQHPDIHLSDPKEPGYFARNYQKGEEWYRKCFNDDGSRVLLDASTSYTMSPDTSAPYTISPLVGVAERIFSCSPDAKLIYLIRNPIQRAYSAYWHNVRAGFERRGFIEALQANDVYLRTSDYALQINEYLKYYDESRIKVFVFEEIIKDPVFAFSECCNFIGIDEYAGVEPIQKNRSFVYKGWLKKLNERLAAHGGINPVLKYVSKLLPQSSKDYLRDKLTNRVPKISDAEYQSIYTLLKPKIDSVEEYLGREITSWK